MNSILSAILTSSLLIIFLSFLSARIELSIKWNWFLVFIPLYFLQTCLLIDSIILIARNRANFKFKLIKLISFLICFILIFSFEILLCLKLEYYPQLKLTFVFIPLWIIISFIIVFLLIKLAKWFELFSIKFFLIHIFKKSLIILNFNKQK